MTTRISELSPRRAAKQRRAANLRAKAYRERDRKRWSDVAKRHRWKLKAETIKTYGGRCACCGEAHLAFLTIDHPGGDGRADREAKCRGQNRGGTDFYRALKATGFPAGYRVLCHNCNQAIGHYGACPHESPEAFL